MLLRRRGLDILVACLAYELEDEIVEHALLWCPGAWPIWRMAGGQPWRSSMGSWLISFLVEIRKSSTKGTTDSWKVRMAYNAY